MPRTEVDLRTAIAAVNDRWAAPIQKFTGNLRRGPVAAGLERTTGVVERFLAMSDAGDALPEIGPDAAEGFVAVLEAYPADLRSTDASVLQLSPDEAVWSAALLTVGALSLGRTGRVDKDLFEVLVSVALGGASRADLLTRFVLTGGKGIAHAERLDLGDDILDGLDDLLGRHPITELLAAGCVADLTAAAIGLAGAASTPPPAIPFIAPVTGCSPNHGRPGTVVVLSGTGWPASQPADVQVVFTSNMGTTVGAAVNAWGPSQITVIAPSRVGVGPVGFASVPVNAGSSPTAGLAMARAIEHCLGPGGAHIADRLAHWFPPAALKIPPVLQPGGANLFTGGPQITVVQPPAVREGDTVTIAGHEFAVGDRVHFDAGSWPSAVASDTSLTAVVPALRGGRRTVLVATPTNDLSNVVGVQVLPTLASLSRAQAKVGDTVEANGSGFDNGTVVTLDGMPAITGFIDSHTVQFTVRRPPLPSSRVVGGDEVQVRVQNPDGALAAGSLPLVVLERTVLVFGDSIAWGQGLVTNQKFGDLVATHLQDAAGSSERIGAPLYLGHSGAVMGTAPAAGTLPSSVTLPAGVTGEVPTARPTVHEQLTAAGAPAVLGGALPGDVRTVILVGGLNSVDIFNVLNPTVSHATLAALSSAFCLTEMKTLLGRMVAQFPVARIVVGGYYPIVSDQSDLNLVMALLAGLGLVVLPAAPVVGAVFGPIGVSVASAAAMAWAKGVVVSNCTFASAQIQADLAQAVKEVNLATPGRDRIAMAAIPWAPEHSIFAPDPWLFGIGFSGGELVPEDPMVAARAQVCVGGPAHCPIASIGHPNAKGAMAYAGALQAALATLA